ncbi:uromodulin-like 1 [Rana temporaria]|uniref:uromodulin-like 1 n=1 Tax=Rana temporaria TaxID=8407 RepID=UPI001AACCEC7|nr:uromodulin-like 1 [Rana temporaria]
MKCLLVLLLALCHILPVYCADEIACGPSNCDCDLSKYNITVVPANVTVECSNGEMDIYISKCQLQKNNFNIYNLELSNNTGSECNNLNVSVNNEPQLAFHNPLAFGKCGNNITINESYVTFSNVLKIYTTSSHIITRNNVSVTVSCTFPLNYTITLNTTLKPKLTTAQLTIPGVFGAVTVLMALYKDDTFTEQITDANSDLSIDSYVYVGFNIPSLQASTFSIKVISIQASTLENSGDVYNLTKGPDGCPDPSFGTDLISVIQNGNGSEARFKLKVFKIANNDYVYLSARVTICSTVCLPQCNGARIAKSGDTSSSQNVAVMEMDVFTSNDYTSGATDRFSKTSTSMLLISLLLFVKLI